MNPNMMNRNSMGCINRSGMTQKDMGSMCRKHGMDSNNGCHSDHDTDHGNCKGPGNMPENKGCRHSGNMPMNYACNRPENMPLNNGCGCPESMPMNNGCGCSGNMPENNKCNCSNDPQLMGMNKNQLLSYINHVSFSMYDTVLFLDTHPTDREAIAYFNEMKQARKTALKIYQKKFAPLLLDGVDADCEWTWGMEPLPWENCEY